MNFFLLLNGILFFSKHFSYKIIPLMRLTVCVSISVEGRGNKGASVWNNGVKAKSGQVCFVAETVFQIGSGRAVRGQLLLAWAWPFLPSGLEPVPLCSWVAPYFLTFILSLLKSHFVTRLWSRTTPSTAASPSVLVLPQHYPRLSLPWACLLACGLSPPTRIGPLFGPQWPIQWARKYLNVFPLNEHKGKIKRFWNSDLQVPNLQIACQ